MRSNVTFVAQGILHDAEPMGVMQNLTLHTPVRIVLLALVACLLGVGVLWADGLRRADRIVEPTRLTPTQALKAEAAPGALVAAGSPADAAPEATAPVTEPATEPVAEVIPTRGGVACATPHKVALVPRELPISAVPGGARVGTMPASSKYLRASTTAWVQAVSADGAWGRVTVPWGKPVNRAGWIPLAGLRMGSTRTMVVADLSDRVLRVFRGCRQVMEVPSAIGASGSPSPTGRFWVTDRVAVPAGQSYFGSYAFGLSTIQPSPPQGWTGGNQMAIHGTNAPGSIGTPASAGCLRVSEDTLAKLRPLLRLGTPVVIQP
ncbi:MAG: L,D-transpeptidase [Thermoleophilia bacterium]|nr:L,D-transpeptidase [Thermoleophilia bacterium]